MEERSRECLRLSDAYTPGAALAERSDRRRGVLYQLRAIRHRVRRPDLDSRGFRPGRGSARSNQFFATPAGDGPLPGLPGVPSFADIYVLNTSVISESTTITPVMVVLSFCQTTGRWCRAAGGPGRYGAPQRSRHPALPPCLACASPDLRSAGAAAEPSIKQDSPIKKSRCRECRAPRACPSPITARRLVTPYGLASFRFRVCLPSR